MKILNLGSLNIDKIYEVEHIAKEGETILSNKHAVFHGGKGLNQSIALARAGAMVYHAGYIGTDGNTLRETLSEAGVYVDLISQIEDVSGHAIIQIDQYGQNSIIVHGGANQLVSKDYIDEVLAKFEAGDMLLLQNEVTNAAYAMTQAKKKGMLVALNPSPITRELLAYPFHQVDYLILNEVEGAALSGVEQFEEMVSVLHQKFPNTAIVLTIGINGVLYQDRSQSLQHDAYLVDAVDTTAAGDTFCGYFLASIAKNTNEVAIALELASKASALAVSTKGASNSIPTLEKVLRFV